MLGTQMGRKKYFHFNRTMTQPPFFTEIISPLKKRTGDFINGKLFNDLLTLLNAVTHIKKDTSLRKVFVFLPTRKNYESLKSLRG
jgi:hypothetical protein